MLPTILKQIFVADLCVQVSAGLSWQTERAYSVDFDSFCEMLSDETC